ncbi:MAG: DUF2793 domain-containing protein [Rhizobiaceae bacterium]
MTDTTARHKLPYIMPSQAQKHVTHNEAIRLIDLVSSLRLVALDMTDPPPDPADGDCHGLGANPTGAWQHHGGEIAAWVDGAWTFIKPFAGLQGWCEADGGIHVHDGAGFVRVDTPPAVLPLLGVNGEANETSRLAVRSQTVLLSHDDSVTAGTGDIRIAINKAGSGNTGSMIFQTAYSGRIELGCTGSDDFTIRASSDGAAFQDVMTVAAGTGYVGIGSPPDQPLAIRKDLAGSVSRIQMRNGSTTSGSGAAITLNGGASQAQLLQYAAGTLYLLTNGAALNIQATGANAVIRLWASGNQVLSASPVKVESTVPLRLPQYAVAALPSAAASGAGALVHVTNDIDGGVVAFSDGSIWRRVTDRAAVATG